MSFEERLIEEVRIRPFLYDPKDAQYKSARLKVNAWKEIGAKFEKTEKMCKTRWKNLRDHFRKLDKKLCADSPDYENDFYEIRWAHYNSLLFLKGIPPAKLENKSYQEDEKDFGLMLLEGTVDDILPAKEECQQSSTTLSNPTPETYPYRRLAASASSSTPLPRYKQRKRQACDNNLSMSEGVSNFFTATQNKESPREKLYKGYAAKIDCANIPDLVKEELDSSINSLIFEKIKEYLTQ